MLRVAINQQQLLNLHMVGAVGLWTQCQLHGTDDTAFGSSDPWQHSPLAPLVERQFQVVEIAFGIFMQDLRVIAHRSAMCDCISQQVG